MILTTHPENLVLETFTAKVVRGYASLLKIVIGLMDNYMDYFNIKAVSKLAGAYDYSIENSDYRNYRDEIGKGYDHYRYSIVDDIDKSCEFNMDVPS